jgi:subtilisin family serine protease
MGSVAPATTREIAMATTQQRKAIRLGRPSPCAVAMDPHLLEILARVEDGAYGDAAELGIDVFLELDRDVLAKCGGDRVALARRVARGGARLDIRAIMGSIATATLWLPRAGAASALAALRGGSPAIRRLKASPFLRLQARGGDFSGSAAEADVEAARIAGLLAGLDGAGVVIGVVDDGCDLAHPNFLVPSAIPGTPPRTRILFHWDQRHGARDDAPPEYGYGRESTAAQIDAWLASRAADAAFDPTFAPPRDSHGTRVLDLAAGNGALTGAAGLAPRAAIIFVQLPAAEFDQPYRVSHSTRVVEAVDYIFARATRLGMPAVVSLSLAAQAGPHDGTALFEIALDALAAQPGRAIVLAAGNDHGDDIHARATIAPGAAAAFDWAIPPQDRSENRLELWYAPGTRPGAALDIRVLPPGRDEADGGAVVPPDHVQDIRHAGRRIGGVVHRGRDSAAHRDGQVLVTVAAAADAPTAGVWRIVVRNRTRRPVTCHAWLDGDERVPGGRRLDNQSRFLPGTAHPGSTVSSFACGRATICVGASIRSTGAAAPYSGRGTTRDGRARPDILAPGEIAPRERIVAAAAGGHAGTGSGTSMAAPQIAGLLALLLQRAAARKETLPGGRDLLAAVRRLCDPSGRDAHPVFPGPRLPPPPRRPRRR